MISGGQCGDWQLKILILHRKDIANLEAGGGTLYIHRVAKYLVQKGHKVTLMCANYSKSKKEENIDGVNILRIGTKHSVFFLAPFHYFRRFRKKMDVLIDVMNGPPWFSPLYSNVPKIAVIFQVFREVFLAELNKPLAFLTILAEKTAPLLYRNMTVVTLSQSVKMELVNMGFSEKNVLVIPPGIDLRKYQPGGKSTLPLVLYVGRLKRYKGVEFLILAMKDVVKRIPKAKLLIAGKGDYVDELIRLTERLGLKSVVSFCGYVSEERKIELMQKAHVIVIPSVMEGWGIPIIEAAACGTPAIGTDTLGLKDTIVNGKTGFLVSYGESEILAEKIIEILENDDLRNKLSKNVTEWARNFEWKKTEQEFLCLIENISDSSKLSNNLAELEGR